MSELDSMKAVALGSTAWRHGLSFSALAVSPDGKVVAGGGDEITLWSASDGALLRRLEFPRGRVFHLAFSLDGVLLAAATGSTLELWGVERRFEAPRDVHALMPDTEGGFVFAWGAPLRISRISADLVETPLAQVDHRVQACALSPDLRWLAVSRAPGELTLYAFPSLEVARRWRLPSTYSWSEDTVDFWGEPAVEGREAEAQLTALAFDAGGTKLFVAGDEPIARCFALDRDEPLEQIALGEREASSLVVDPTGTRVAIAHQPLVGGAGPAKLWRLGTPEVKLLAASGPALAFSPVSGRLFVGSSAHRVVPHDLEGVPVASESGSRPYALASTPDGALVLGLSSTSVCAWSAADGRVQWETQRADHWANALCCSPDGAAVLMTASGQKGAVEPVLLRLELRTGAIGPALGPLPAHPLAIAVSADGALVAACGHGDEVMLRDARTPGGEPLLVLQVPGPRSLCFLPGREGLVVAQKSGTLSVFRWDGAPGPVEPQVLHPDSPGSPNGPNDDAGALAISRDGRRALSSWNDVVRLWDLEGLVELQASPPSSRMSDVLAVGFGPDEGPRALLAVRTEKDAARYEGTSLQLWAAGALRELKWIPSKYYTWSARAHFLDDGQRFVLVGDDGVARVYPVPAA